VVEKIKPRDWDQVMAVNLRAPYLLLRLCLPRMKKAKRGQIINVNSGAGKNGIAEYSAYCASKFGLLGLTESVGPEARQYGVKVQSVMPGSTDTHFMGRRPGKAAGRLRPEDVADLVVFLVRQDEQAWTSEANLRPLVLKR
jgi:NAD(P)-dependent dehydrogenase (short-subunit alcohol dehydrogenase family)